MSIAAQARASRIDTEATSIAKEVARANASLAALFDRATNFTAFMNGDPLAEFSQVDRDKYKAAFITAVGELGVTMAKLEPLQTLYAEQITKEAFVAAHTGVPPLDYSNQFDR